MAVWYWVVVGVIRNKSGAPGRKRRGLEKKMLLGPSGS